LEATRVPLNKRNIWADPDDAAILRSVADGKETVPMLIIGPVALVNPTVRHVRRTLAEHVPHLR